MFSLRHIYDFQLSHNSSPPNPMLKFISDKYQFQYLRELWSIIAVIANGRTRLERDSSDVMEGKRGEKYIFIAQPDLPLFSPFYYFYTYID